jgi:hypothetical protein
VGDLLVTLQAYKRLAADTAALAPARWPSAAHDLPAPALRSNQMGAAAAPSAALRSFTLSPLLLDEAAFWAPSQMAAAVASASAGPAGQALAGALAVGGDRHADLHRVALLACRQAQVWPGSSAGEGGGNCFCLSQGSRGLLAWANAPSVNDKDRFAPLPPHVQELLDQQPCARRGGGSVFLLSGPESACGLF